MKKLSLLLAFSLAFLFSVMAQENSRVVSSETTQNENDGKNWFLGVGLQGNVYVNDNAKDSKVWTKPSLGGDAFLGKWFSHKVGARLFVEGGSLHPYFNKMQLKETESYIAGRLDLMLNVTNLFRQYSPDRFYNLIAYVGPGYGDTFSDKNRPDKKTSSASLFGGAGLLNTFRLSNNVALFVNIGGNIVNANFDGWKAGEGNKEPTTGYSIKDDSKLNGIASGAIGLIFNLGGSSKKEVVPPPVVPQEQPKQYVLALRSNDANCGSVSGAGTFNEGTRVTAVATPRSGCRFVNWTENGTAVSTSTNYTFPLGANRSLVANYEAIPTPPPPPPPAAAVVLDPVFFRLDKSIIDPEQEIKVQKAAEFLKSNPSAKLHVVGYADVETAYPKYNMALSQRRSKAVANQLVKKYGIDSSRLILDWKGDTVQPFSVNEKNRVVMFSENK